MVQRVDLEVREDAGFEREVRKYARRHAEKKKKDDVDREGLEDVIWKAAIAAIIIGVLVTAYLVYQTQQESYSALYIRPDAYSNYIEGDTVAFTYGVQCYETKKTLYDVSVYLDETVVAQKQFEIDGRGKTVEDTVAFEAPKNLEFPVKVRIEMSASGQIYETHFWLKGRK